MNRERLEKAIANNAFCQDLGLVFTHFDDGHLKAELKPEKRHLQQTARIHGGVLSSVVDIVGGFAVYSLCSANIYPVTSSLNVNYLRPVESEIVLRAEASVVKMGSTLAYVEMWIRQEGEAILVKANAQMALVPSISA